MLELPSEIMDMIYEEMQFTEVVCFSLTCKTLLAHGEKHINECISMMVSDWYGCRLVCIGDDDADFAGLPPNLLTDEERLMIEAESNVNPDLPNARGPSLYDYACEHFPCVSRIPTSQWIDWELILRMTLEDRKRLNEITTPNYGSQRNDWVLGNLTKGEYVRASAIAELNQRPDAEQPWLPNCRPNLSQVLLARICWSCSPSVAMKYEGGINRGVWAGDRFIITTMDRLPSPMNGGWTDVSKEVSRELKAIWEASLPSYQWDFDRWMPKKGMEYMIMDGLPRGR